MVELPEGKMKSREGTVVDADDLLEKMYNTAKETSLELGKIDNMTEQEQDELFKMLSLGAESFKSLVYGNAVSEFFKRRREILDNSAVGLFISYADFKIA